MPIEVNSQPKYQIVKSLLEEQITKGEIAQGAFLPPEKDLMTIFRVSKSTIRSALKELHEEKVISKQQGQPSRVIASPGKRSNNKMQKIAWFEDRYIENPLYYEIFKSASVYAEKLLTSLSIVSLNDSDSRNLFLANIESYIGGIITSNDPALFSKYSSEINRMNNLACLDHINAFPANLYVGTDHYAGTSMAMQHLIDTGHRRIVFLGVSTSFYTYAPFHERFQAYRDTLKANGIKEDPHLQIISTEMKHFYDIRTLLEETFAKNKDIDAVFAISDTIAIDAVYALNSLSINVPFDVSVIGFDGLLPGQRISPKLTTVRQPWEKIGQLLVEDLQKDIGKNHSEPERIKLMPELQIGESTLER